MADPRRRPGRGCRPGRGRRGGPERGRVEIFWNGRWGTVCDEYFDLIDGGVVCRQLGFRRAAEVFLGAGQGQGRGPIWLDSLQCTGREPTLDACQHTGFGVHNCGHHEDAGLACEGAAVQ